MTGLPAPSSDALASYPFGVPPTDAFSTATCPACRGVVGVALHYCPTCLATYDATAARRDLVYRGGPEASIARNIHLGIALLGACVAGLYALVPSAALLGIGLTMVGVGIAGRLAFPRLPLASSVVASVFVLAGFVGLVVLWAMGSHGGYQAGRLLAVLVAILIALMRGLYAGVKVGLRVVGLKVIPRPRV